MIESEQMKEKLNPIRRLLTAHVASERILVAVVAHVHGVHHHIAEQKIAIGTIVNLSNVLPAFLSLTRNC